MHRLARGRPATAAQRAAARTAADAPATLLALCTPGPAGGPRAFVYVEDAATVHLRAKALTARSASPGIPAAALPPPAAPAVAAPPAMQPAAEQPAAAPRPFSVPPTEWSSDMDAEEEAEEAAVDEEEEAEACAAAAWRPGPGSMWASSDPTVRLALALGLDPRRLPALGGHGTRGGTPAAGALPCFGCTGYESWCRRLPGHVAAPSHHALTCAPAALPSPAAIKALRFALAHPAAAPSLMAGPATATGHHLQLTASCLAKQRRKAGVTAAAGGGKARVQTIDALLGAMRHRLQAVQEAMAADMAAAAAEQARQRQMEAAEAAVAAQARAASASPVPASGCAVADAMVGNTADGGVEAPAAGAAAGAAGGPLSPRARLPKREALDTLLRQHADALREQQRD